MRRSASDRALGVMTRPAVHRRAGLFETSITTSFSSSLGLVRCGIVVADQYRQIRDGMRPCRHASWAACPQFRRAVRLPHDGGPLDHPRIDAMGQQRTLRSDQAFSLWR